MRKTVAGVVITLIGTGCFAPGVDDPPTPAAVRIEGSPTPFTHVSAGDVTAMVPDGWRPLPASDDAVRGGFLASPRPHAWRRMDGAVPGMSATWVDATRVGIPSDYYYLAATGPLLATLTHSTRCEAERHRVILDRRPDLSGTSPSRGDYVARGEGTCRIGGGSTRWAYFVAAPGFGPVRKVGIPASGLYVVVAVAPEGARANVMLDRLIRRTSFGGSSVAELVAAAGS